MKWISFVCNHIYYWLGDSELRLTVLAGWMTGWLLVFALIPLMALKLTIIIIIIIATAIASVISIWNASLRNCGFGYKKNRHSFTSIVRLPDTINSGITSQTEFQFFVSLPISRFSFFSIVFKVNGIYMLTNYGMISWLYENFAGSALWNIALSIASPQQI